MTVGLSSSVHAADEGLGIAESDLRGCTQCGTCSAVCPMIDYMEYSPRALNALRLGGHYEEALHSTGDLGVHVVLRLHSQLPQEASDH